MANLYLVQALYCAKPSVPTRGSIDNGTRRDHAGQTKPAEQTIKNELPGESSMTSCAPVRALSLIEKLYGENVPSIGGNSSQGDVAQVKVESPVDRLAVPSASTHKAPPQDYTYADGAAPRLLSSHGVPSGRAMLMRSNHDVAEKRVDRTKSYKPKQSNGLPVSLPGAQTKPNGNPIGQTLPPDAPTDPSSHRVALKFPAERYLPPSGPYYDQFSLSQIFGPGFFHDCCFSCVLLYCSTSWYGDRRIPCRIIGRPLRQVRPAKNEFAVLLQMGLLLKPEPKTNGIVPNMLHPIVRQFYHDKPAPKQLNQRMTTLTPRSNIGRELSARTETQNSSQISSPAQSSARLPKSVRFSLDPHPQNRSKKNISSISAETRPTVLAKTTIVCITQPDVLPAERGSSNGYRDMDDRLQKLEEEVLELKKENIAKDREIRKLRTENEQMRGGNNGYEMGTKRQRLL
ncbi:hypothetical protein P153DRAFT_393127 [Dothidotthia symphoricarpi CBS 119687]|uniref:Uncharacterized protein n=1 Tax=Dothidotthia symphoricarpi CBS 119687 TaxID=1392245 RepID=A0A6A6AQ52_9PLEO|nr:uncharacterized protein P153DRAFT_393127 [Dothidotthia symphoricarpi CBS 119687]KAF2133288.1 hypothetical protein P153DRAFT_393127 [Dothidotthia symphoricarpi CBS 119687]